MGFSGGGSNILKPHTHDSTIVQDGGNLDFKNITQGDMSAGSLTQSDGVHLQELLIGNPSDVPRVNGAGTAVEWHTPTATGAMELLGSSTLVAAAANLEITGTWTAADYSYFIIEGGFSNDNSGATPSLEMRLNNSAAPNYHTNMILNTAGTLSATSTSPGTTSGQICTTACVPPSSTETCQTTITLQLSVQNTATTFRWNWSNTPMWKSTYSGPGTDYVDTEQITGAFANNGVTGLTKVDFFFSDASNFRIGSNIFLYGVKRT